MNISRALQHPTQDPNFVQKLAVTSLVGMVPILNFALYGYALEHSKNVVEGRDTPLPTWDNLGAKFERGLMLGLAQLVYLAPVLLVYGCFIIFAIGGVGLANTASTRQQSRDIGALFGVGTIAVMCVVGLMALAISLLSPGVYRQYYTHGTFASCFKFGEVLAYTRRRIGDIVLAWLALGAIGLVVGLGSMVLSLVPCLGTLAVLALSFALTGYLIAVHAHLMGQMILKDSQVSASLPAAGTTDDHWRVRGGAGSGAWKAPSEGTKASGLYGVPFRMGFGRRRPPSLARFACPDRLVDARRSVISAQRVTDKRPTGASP